MMRSRTANTIHELAAEGTSIHAIATMLGLSRDTERKYPCGAVTLTAMTRPRRKRGSKIDPFKQRLQERMEWDHHVTR